MSKSPAALAWQPPLAPPSPTTPMLVVEGAVATIVLNRPAHRNRLENQDLQKLLACFQQIEDDHRIQVLVLTANTTGQPRPVFCAGYDIGGFDGGPTGVAFEEVPDALANLRPVTVCALNGSVYGGATDLFLACDVRVALTGIEFRMPATALGLHYYASGLERFVTRLGPAAAKRAFLTARPFTAQRLYETGCLEAIASAADFDTTVAHLVGDVAALAPLAVQATKQSLNEIATGNMNWEQLKAREALTAQSADFAEGRLAFAEKRTPRFMGR